MLARHRAGRSPTAATPGPGLTDTPGRVSGWPGRSPLPGAGTGTAGSRPCPELASRRRRSAGSWPGAGSWRTRPNGAGTVPAGSRRLPHPAAWPTGASRPDSRTGSGWRTSPGSGPGTGMACLSPPVDCHDGRIVAHAAGFGPDAELADRMPEEAVATPPGGARPLIVFCQVVIGQCGVSFPSEKAVGFSPVRNWPVIARVLLFHCIRA